MTTTTTETPDPRNWCHVCVGGAWTMPEPSNRLRCARCQTYYDKSRRPPTYPDVTNAPLSYQERTHAEFVRREIGRGRYSEEVAT